MSLRLVVLLLVVALPSGANAAGDEKPANGAARLDLHGDPLPAGRWPVCGHPPVPHRGPCRPHTHQTGGS